MSQRAEHEVAIKNPTADTVSLANTANGSKFCKVIENHTTAKSRQRTQHTFCIAYTILSTQLSEVTQGDATLKLEKGGSSITLSIYAAKIKLREACCSPKHQ